MHTNHKLHCTIRIIILLFWGGDHECITLVSAGTQCCCLVWGHPPRPPALLPVSVMPRSNVAFVGLFMLFLHSSSGSIKSSSLQASAAESMLSQYIYGDYFKRPCSPGGPPQLGSRLRCRSCAGRTEMSSSHKQPPCGDSTLWEDLNMFGGQSPFPVGSHLCILLHQCMAIVRKFDNLGPKIAQPQKTVLSPGLHHQCWTRSNAMTMSACYAN